jgi:hypothetical protein
MMDSQGKGWDCGHSNGEALSRVLATQRYPRELVTRQGSFATGHFWLETNRDDFVSHTHGSDGPCAPVGCATLFINYLQRQRGFSLHQITQAGGGMLSDTYKTLTGRTDAFAPFKALLARRFAPGASAPLITDNPFPIHPDLLFYDASAGTGEFYSTDSQANMTKLQTMMDMRSSWTQIVPGNFTNGAFADLLFYDPSSGTGEFYTTDGHGNIHQVSTKTGYRESWKIIVPAKFSGGRLDDLLFYDPGAGTGEFDSTDGHGNLHRLSSHNNWRNTWSVIFPANFTGGKYPDLFFYDPNLGDAEIFTTDGMGNLTLLSYLPNLSRTWSIIVPCNVTGGQSTDLLFYDQSAGLIQFFTSDMEGRLTLLGSLPNQSKTWSIIQPIAFAEFMFYDRAAGLGSFFTSDVRLDPETHKFSLRNLTLLQSFNSWRTSWDLISPGNYS